MSDFSSSTRQLSTCSSQDFHSAFPNNISGQTTEIPKPEFRGFWGGSDSLPFHHHLGCESPQLFGRDESCPETYPTCRNDTHQVFPSAFFGRSIGPFFLRLPNKTSWWFQVSTHLKKYYSRKNWIKSSTFLGVKKTYTPVK